MKKIIVYQEETSDCGVCCLLSIIRYYKGDANLEALRIDSNTTNKGVTAYDLIACAKKNGFNAKGYKDKNLSKYKVPCILHIQISKSLTHFVCLYGISCDKYKIMDPARGIIYLNESELMAIFTGYLIELEPLYQLPNRKNINFCAKKMLFHLKSQKYQLIAIIILNFIFIILNIIASFYIKIYNYPDYVSLLSILFMGLNILLSIISYIIYKRLYKVNIEASYNLTDNFFTHIFGLPLKYLHLKDPGEIIKRDDEDNLINDVIINGLITSLLDTLIIVSILAVLANLSYIYVLEFALFLIISIFILVKLTKNIHIKAKSAIESETDYNNLLMDTIYGLTSIKHSKSEKYIQVKLGKYYQDKQKQNQAYNHYCKRYEVIKTILTNLLRLGININLLSLIYSKTVGFENLIIVDLLFEVMLASFSNIETFIVNMLFIKNLVHKANDFYNIPLPEKKGKTFQNGNIEINYLNYQYYDTHPLIENFTTTIKKGEKVIIKGPSGSGKSTLCKILYREIDNYEGQILINGINIQNINLESYQNRLIYSSQSEKIFSGTIRENILLGKDIDEKHLEQIVKICKVDRILARRTFGLDSMLYTAGEELSGGERQLIILARALVSDFDILILDETLSEVSDTLENSILANLFAYFPDKTIIYVSHKNKKDYFKRVINV